MAGRPGPASEALEASCLAGEELSLHNLLHVFRHPSFPEGRESMAGDALRASLGMPFRVGTYRVVWAHQGTPSHREYEIIGTPDGGRSAEPAWTDYARAGGERESAMERLADQWVGAFRIYNGLAEAFDRWRRRVALHG